MNVKEKTIGLPELTMEFLRRVVNELNGRRFEFIEPGDLVLPEKWTEMVSASGSAENIFHFLPECTREFAGKIKPEFTRCYQLNSPRWSEDRHYFARDPISGLSIRAFKHWDVMESQLMYRFDSAFH